MFLWEFESIINSNPNIKKMKKLTIGILTMVTMFVLSSCAKNVDDNLLEKSHKALLSAPSAVTITGDDYGCWYTSKIVVGKMSQIKNSYIWVIRNVDAKSIDPDPSVNYNSLYFGSNTQPFHSNPASKSVSDIRDWIISAIAELGGSDPVSGQWQCDIDSSNPDQINVTIYNNADGCGNVETVFPNYGLGVGSGIKTAVFVSFDLVNNL
jgi:hypothetical protein